MYCPTVYFIHTAIMCLAVVKFLSITTVCIVFTDEELLCEERKRQSMYLNPHLPPVNIPCHFFVCVMLKLSSPPYCIITKKIAALDKTSLLSLMYHKHTSLLTGTNNYPVQGRRQVF